MGKRFKGVVHLLENKIYLYESGKNSEIGENIIINGVDNPQLDEILIYDFLALAHIPENHPVNFECQN
jgi:peptide chain release factor 3